MRHSHNNIFTFREIEQSLKVGLVEKVDKKRVKDFIDRLIGYTPRDNIDKKITLCEMKARVAPTTLQHERERVLQHHSGKNISVRIQTHLYLGHILAY